MCTFQNHLQQKMEVISYFEIVLPAICLLYLWILFCDDGLPWNWPLLGMLPWLSRYVNQIHDKAADLLGRRTRTTFLFKGPWLTSMDMLVTVDPANVQYIMTTNFQNFPKGADFIEIFDLFGDWISNADSDLWRNQRKLAQVLLNDNRFHQFSAKTSLEKLEKGLIPVLEHVSEKGLVVDMQELFQRLTFDTAFLSVTGYDVGCLSVEFPEVPFSKAMDKALEVIFLRHVIPRPIWKIQRWLNIGSERKMSEAWKIIDHFINNCLSKKRKELRVEGNKSKEETDGVDLITLYINENDETSFGLQRDDKFLRDTIFGYMLAGRDTSSASLTWFFWLIITHPKVEEKIIEELKQIIPQNEAEKFRLFSVQELSKATYLHAALCEALRLYPSIPFQHKVAIKPDILPSGDHVHPNMRVILSVYAMGRTDSIWGRDCREFKPERWISDRGTIKHEPSYKFMAFNSGPRTCPGKGVALTQLKSVAATIIHNYHVQVVEGHPVAPNMSIMLNMKYGLKVKVTKRWS